MYKTNISLLPIESAIIDGPELQKRRYVIPNENVAEINSFVFSDFRSTKLLIASLADHGMRLEISKAFCLGNPQYKSVASYHKRSGWLPSFRA